MANSVRNDSSDFTNRPAGQQPIVLARLPRVGAAAPAMAPTNPTGFQVVPPPEVMPQLDLRTEIDQRIKLHIADTPTDQDPSTNYFADREHAVEPQLMVRQPAPAPITRHTSTKTQTTVAAPTTFSEKLFQLHAQLSPHAGLIVALALIASAGLLYWMIVGPSQAPMSPSFENYRENYSESYSENLAPELQDDGFGTAPHYTPEFTVDVPQSVEPQAAEPLSSPDQWTKILEMPNSIVHPVAKPPTLQELPLSEDPFFPTTTYPVLDFTLLKQPITNLPQSLPEVARRPTAPTHK